MEDLCPYCRHNPDPLHVRLVVTYDDEWDEWSIKYYLDDMHSENRTWYGSDMDDAVATAQHMKIEAEEQGYTASIEADEELDLGLEDYSQNPTPGAVKRLQTALDNVGLYPGDSDYWVDLLHASWWPSKNARVWVNLPPEITERLAARFKCDKPPTEGILIHVGQVGAAWIDLLVKDCKLGQSHPTISLSIRNRPTVSRVELTKVSPYYAQLAEEQNYPPELPFPLV